MSESTLSGADIRLSEALGLAYSAAENRDWSNAYSILSSQPGPLPAPALELLAACALKTTSIAEACSLMESAFSAHVEDGNALAAAKAASHLVGLYEAAGAEAACAAWEQRGLRLLDGVGPCIERGYLALSRTGCEVHDPRELEGRADLALEMATAFGDRNLELRARAEKGLALVCLGFVNAGFAFLDDVMASIAAGELRDDDMKGRSICSMLSACERTGDVARAEYWCKRIEEDARLQHVLLGTHCKVTYGVVEALRGDWHKAEATLGSVLTASLAIPYHRAISAGRLAEVLILQGKLDEAAEVLKGFEDRFEAMPALAAINASRGQFEQAGALLRSVIRGLGHDSIRLAPVLAELIRVELLRGDPIAARKTVDHLQSLENASESNEIRAYTRLSEARLARHDGDLDQASDDLDRALTLLTHYERPLLCAQIRLELARTLSLLDHSGAALVEAQAALATFRRLGVAMDVTAAEALIEAVTATGSVAPHQPLAAPSDLDQETPLSERENQVATLVSQGLTNKQIAENLVLSVRTVEGHVDRILGKLDFHSRAQLASWVATRPTRAPNAG